MGERKVGGSRRVGVGTRPNALGLREGEKNLRGDNARARSFSLAEAAGRRKSSGWQG